MSPCPKCGQPREKRRCRACANEYQRAYRAQRDPEQMREYRRTSAERAKADPERVAKKAAAQHAYKLKTKYGLTPEQYDALLAKQEHACAICAGPLDKSERYGPKHPYVDHCHVTGRVRGILCPACNTLLGMAKDNPVILTAAVMYLATQPITAKELTEA